MIFEKKRRVLKGVKGMMGYEATNNENATEKMSNARENEKKTKRETKDTITVAWGEDLRA